ncbi:MAG: alkaline phosphatase family protein [Candidatus Dormibacteraeota bacterium]|nr:alkaline phosphatase family protein [Candidatus Dormibacteraeota bacterium]
MRKILYVVLDGLGDRPVESLGGRTPLEAAATPHLDALAARGQTGLMDAIGPGIAPESDAAVMSILGYDVDRYYTGRGPLESYGAGLDVRDGDLAWRANFGTVDPDWTIVDRRVGRNLSDAEARELADAVQSDVRLKGTSFQFRHTLGHRACLVIRREGGALSGQVDNCDPAYQRHGTFSIALADPGKRVLEAKPLEDSDAARAAAELTNEFMRKSYEVLSRHPVNQRRTAEGKMPGNMILLRDAGDRLPHMPSFQERFGIRFASLVEMPVEIGIASLLGMGQVPVASTAEDPERGYGDWAAKTLASLDDWDGLYVHLKGPDVPGHDGDPAGKQRSVEQIDTFYFGPLMRRLDGEEFVVAVTADHSTPCELKAHSDDPVPVLVCGGLEPEGAEGFSERVARNGWLGRLQGKELVPKLVSLSK